MNWKITKAGPKDVPTILRFIQELAEYEKLSHEVFATESGLTETLFGKRPLAEVIFIEENSQKLGFAIFFHTYSTFLAKPGIYLEDLFVLPTSRGKGFGKHLLSHLAQLALERDCARIEWAVLDWNKPAVDFYRALGAQSMTDWTTNRLEASALEKLARYNKES